MLILSFKISIIVIQTIKALQFPFPTPRTREKSAKTREKQGKKSTAQNRGVWGKKSDFWPQYLPLTINVGYSM